MVGSPIGPDVVFFLPIKILLLKYVPVVSITVFDLNLFPLFVIIPSTEPFSTISLSTKPSIRVRLFVDFNNFNIYFGYSNLSICALSALTAGPFDELSIFI